MIEILTQKTGDPCSIKFFPGYNLFPDGSITFESEKDASSSEMALALINLEGVEKVSFCENFVLVTKNEEVEWELLSPDIMLVLLDFADLPLFKEKVEGLMLNDEVGKKIQRILEERVRPVVVDDGGELEFLGWKGDKAYIRVAKACAGCPSAGAELKDRVTRLLNFYLEEIQEVILV